MAQRKVPIYDLVRGKIPQLDISSFFHVPTLESASGVGYFSDMSRDRDPLIDTTTDLILTLSRGCSQMSRDLMSPIMTQARSFSRLAFSLSQQTISLLYAFDPISPFHIDPIRSDRMMDLSSQSIGDRYYPTRDQIRIIDLSRSLSSRMDGLVIAPLRRELESIREARQISLSSRLPQIHTLSIRGVPLDSIRDITGVLRFSTHTRGWQQDHTDLDSIIGASRELRLSRSDGALSMDDIIFSGSDPIVSICPPLAPPSGALDIADLTPRVKGRQYFDIFIHRLSFSQRVRRTWTHLRGAFLRWGMIASYVMAGFLILSIPIFWYIRYSLLQIVEHLPILLTASSESVLRSELSQIRSGLTRSQLLLSPYRLFLDNALIQIPEVAALGAGIDAGSTITHGISELFSTIHPTDTPIVSTQSGSTDQRDQWRAVPRDLSLGAPWGIDSPTEWLRENETTITSIFSALTEVTHRIDSLDLSEYQDSPRVEMILTTLRRFESLSQYYLTHRESFLTMLGDQTPQRYLILNQNQDELRTNGGFPGSVITFSLYKGNIMDLRLDDVYYYDWNLFPYRAVAPPGIALMTDAFGLRDVNYYPIFRDTVEKANEFIERSGDASITTGIAIHQGILTELLRVTGPVRVPGVEIPVSSENFSALMSTLVAARHAEVKTPKDTLFTFIEVFVKQIHDEKKYLEVLDILSDFVARGEVLIASRETQTQAFLEQIGFGEKWKYSDHNWIYPVYTSLSGNKSDRYMTRSWTGSTVVGTGCVMTNTVTVESQHSFGQSDRVEIDSYLDMIQVTDPDLRARLSFIQGDGPNRQYIRLIVPPQSSLISEGDFEYTEGDEYDTIAFTVETPVGSTARQTISYQSLVGSCQADLEWYHQPGLRGEEEGK